VIRRVASKAHAPVGAGAAQLVESAGQDAVFRPFNSGEGSEECVQHGRSLDRRTRSRLLDTSARSSQFGSTTLFRARDSAIRHWISIDADIFRNGT
jgi:hypothetical protein